MRKLIKKNKISIFEFNPKLIKKYFSLKKISKNKNNKIYKKYKTTK